jgi:hypothetical protein
MARVDCKNYAVDCILRAIEWMPWVVRFLIKQLPHIFEIHFGNALRQIVDRSRALIEITH